MSLLPCRECGKHVSAQARACPHCGAPFPWKKVWNGIGVDWKSSATLCGYPLVHIAFGRDVHGRLRVAKGVIAIGQFAIGAITIAQFGVGFLFGFGQFMLGLTAVAQFAIAAVIGIGQFATGHVAMGQLVLGYYALAQMGLAPHIYSVDRKNIDLATFFGQMILNAKIYAAMVVLAVVLFFPRLRSCLSWSKEQEGTDSMPFRKL